MASSTFLYGSVLTVLGVTYSILAWQLERRGLYAPSLKLRRSRFTAWRNLVGALVYPAATLLALAYPRVSIAIYFILAVFYFTSSGQEARPS
jgi:hypothetical protein